MQIQIQQLRKRLPLIIAIACGIWAILLLNGYLKRRETEIWEKMRQTQQQTQAARPSKIVIVLVANKDIPTQTPITPADIVMKDVPAEYVQPGAINSLDQVIGQIASSPIAAGEQILKTKLLPPGKIGKSLSQITPTGKRAISVTVDNLASITNLLRPGDHVDVLAIINLPEAGATQTSAKTAEPQLISLFQNVEVLAIGSETGPPAESAKKEPAKTAGAAGGTVTLALTPQEAGIISFVQEHGKIKLSLRSSEDTNKETVRPVDWDTLFQYLYPSKEGQGQGQQPVVEIYRGSSREIVPLYEKQK